MRENATLVHGGISPIELEDVMFKTILLLKRCMNKYHIWRKFDALKVNLRSCGSTKKRITKLWLIIFLESIGVPQKVFKRKSQGRNNVQKRSFRQKFCEGLRSLQSFFSAFVASTYSKLNSVFRPFWKYLLLISST